MAIDKNLFLHGLSIVAILKNEGPYLKEWLDYHLIAGVDHFYLYDNESPDNQAEVVAPYVEAGLVDYFHAPGKVMQFIVYNDAVKRFKFQSRYMAFIDGDEFIFPKTNRGIVEVVDEILSRDLNAAGLAINWQYFGSNGLEKADYSRGVLERFTRRAPKDWAPNKKGGNAYVKLIANPRKINFICEPHIFNYFEGYHSVNENGAPVWSHINFPITADKIAVNHYLCKSREEYSLRNLRGDTIRLNGDKYDNKLFNEKDRNEVFDDGILKYRAARADKFSLERDEQKIQRITDALIKTFEAQEFSIETALTCRAVSNYLGEKLLEEASLGAVLKSIGSGIDLADIRLLLGELPELLILPYPAVKEIRVACLNIIPQIIEPLRVNSSIDRYYLYKDLVNLDYIRRLLQIWK